MRDVPNGQVMLKVGTADTSSPKQCRSVTPASSSVCDYDHHFVATKTSNHSAPGPPHYIATRACDLTVTRLDQSRVAAVSKILSLPEKRGNVVIIGQDNLEDIIVRALRHASTVKL